MLSAKDLLIAETIYRLIRSSTSMNVVKSFLKGKGLTFSAGSWDELFTDRIKPPLVSGQIKIDELRTLLQEVEECGRQHIFLFKGDPVRTLQMVNPQNVLRKANQMGLQGLIGSPIELELPKKPTFVDIRIIVNNKKSKLIVKQVETRTTTKYLHSTFDKVTSQMSKVYSVLEKRAINIACLHSDGLLEIRIASQDNSTKYEKNVRTFFHSLAPLIAYGEFRAIGLHKAKTKIWEDRKALSKEIRYNNSVAKNDLGIQLNISTATYDENLSEDAGSENALQAFIDEDGQVTSSNIHFVVPSVPEREIHVLLGGDLNEFAITAACTTEDYEYVCGKILSLNK